MLAVVELEPRDPSRAADLILAAWKRHEVVHLRAPGLRDDETRAFYDAILPLIGTRHFLAEDGRTEDRQSQRTSELWMEVRYDPAYPHAYRHSRSAQPLHTDGSYIALAPNATLMCCVRNADEGGETVFLRGSALVDALRTEDPELLADLERLDMPHARSGDRRVLPVIRRADGHVRLNWNYHCVATDASSDAVALRERFFWFLQDSPGVRRSLVPVKLRSGDAVVWKDELVLHGRNAFHATAASERFLWKCCLDVDVFEADDGSAPAAPSVGSVP